MPMIFYGDEQGVSGIEEIDYRKPMPWDKENTSLFNYYQSLIRLRKENMALMLGGYKTLIAEGSCYGYERVANGQRLIVVINNSEKALVQHISVETTRQEVKDYLEDRLYFIHGSKMTVVIPPSSAAVILLK